LHASKPYRGSFHRIPATSKTLVARTFNSAQRNKGRLEQGTENPKHFLCRSTVPNTLAERTRFTARPSGECGEHHHRKRRAFRNCRLSSVRHAGLFRDDGHSA